MQKSPEKISAEALLSIETVPLDQARFADPLEMEVENAWADIVSTINSTGETHYEYYKRLWSDDALPQAFRDRAMLVIQGTSEARKGLGVHQYSYYGGDWFHRMMKGEDPEKEIRYQNRAEFVKWTNQAFEYQQKQGTEFISEAKLLKWWCEMLTRGELNSEELHHNLDRINIGRASPTEDSEGYRYDYNRFPLLHDILRTDIYGDRPSLKVWARTQLDNWLKFKRGEEITLPSWLSGINEEVGFKLYNQLALSANPHNPESPKWSSMRSSVEHFGWTKFINPDNRVRDARTIQDTTTKFLRSIDVQDMRTDLLRHIVDNNLQFDLKLGKELAEESGDQMLIDQVSQIQAKAETIEAERAARYEAESLARRVVAERKAVKERQQQEARHTRAQTRFKGLLETVKQVSLEQNNENEGE